MHLSLLSDAFISDSLNDAAFASCEGIADAPSHFAALCRGLVVVAALSLPVGLTLLAQADFGGRAVQADTNAAARGMK